MLLGWCPGLVLGALMLSHSLALPYPPAPPLGDDEGEIYEDVDVFQRHTRKHARPMFYINCGYRDLCYCYSKVTRHHYCCSCDVGACFPAQATVTTPHGPVAMDALATGDTVLAVNASGHVVTSSIIGFMDRRPHETSLYVTLRTSTGANLTLSPNHVLFKAHPNSSHPVSVFGGDVVIGDLLFAASNESVLQPVLVVAINHQVTKGAYVPLTHEGTLVVDGVYVSCYASYSHTLVHSFLAPVRTLQALIHPRPGFIASLISSWTTAFITSLTAPSPLIRVASRMREILGSVVALERMERMTFCNQSQQEVMEAVLGTGLDWDEDEAMEEQEMKIAKENNRKMIQKEREREAAWQDGGEGESYYISLLKVVGRLGYSDQRAPPHVLQLNTKPHTSLFVYPSFPSPLNSFMPSLLSFPSLLRHLPSFFGLLGRSW